MRFFSNEAQDNVDDKNDHPTDPDTTAPVPQQRAGSPWQHDTDPAPQTAADGASTVGDPDRTVAFSDGVTRDRDDAEPAPKHSLPDDTAPRHKLPDEDGKAEDHKTDQGVRTDDAGLDSALDDRGTFDDPHLKETDATPAALTDSEPEDRVEDEPAVLDEPGPAPDPVVAPVTEPVAETPAESGPMPFFPAADTQPLRDRWRDVQLRFVDDPKGATADAAGLVDEAVDKLSQALRDHRGSFAKGTDDTEALRVELRSYRDILDRLLGL
ncbi:hypothetical protein [Actinoplanes philippinensis]|uniref:hypothetical protein n=1 Tax=Actinoplanes philippinensis TaxID=35752 RepID=UPI0033C5FF6F